jgi:hypothetical protein
MNIKVGYSFGYDVGNYFNSLYKFNWLKHGRRDIQKRLLKPFPQNFKVALKKSKTDDEAKEIIKTFLLGNVVHRKEKYKKISEYLELAWKKDGQEIERGLEKLYEQPLPFKKINIYLSSLPISPYKYPEWILIYSEMPTERQLEVIKHELNHFMFYYYYDYLMDELGKEKFESLKEALTIFTNTEERGYPKEQKLRKWLKFQQGSIPKIIEGGKWRKYL